MIEHWTYVGMRAIENKKTKKHVLTPCYTRGDSDGIIPFKHVPLPILGGVYQITLSEDRTKMTVSGENGPKFLKREEHFSDRKADYFRKELEAVDFVKLERALEKLSQDSPSLGELTLSEVRSMMKQRFGSSRTQFIGTILEYITR